MIWHVMKISAYHNVRDRRQYTARKIVSDGWSQVPIASELLSKVTLNIVVSGNDSGSAAYLESNSLLNSDSLLPCPIIPDIWFCPWSSLPWWLAVGWVGVLCQAHHHTTIPQILKVFFSTLTPDFSCLSFAKNSQILRPSVNSLLHLLFLSCCGLRRDGGHHFWSW